MSTIAQNVYRDASIGGTIELPKAGTPLENSWVYDSSAREIKAMAEQGLVKIVSERRASERDDAMITAIAFVKMG
jgi:hypothetical protein